jgi:hypothetical protein
MGRARNRKDNVLTIKPESARERVRSHPPRSPSAATPLVTQASAHKRREAEECCRALLAQGAEAVALFGSVARGDANELSDIDLLIVSQTRLLHSELKLPDLPIGPAFFSWEKLRAPGAQPYAFLTIVASEAVMLHDPGDRLQTALSQMQPPSKEEISADIERIAHSLDRFDDITRYEGLYLSMLADCYRYAKGAAIVASVHAHQPQARRDDAFAWLLTRHPELSTDVQILREIEPHYLVTMDKLSGEELPFEAEVERELAASALAAAKRVIATAYQ